MELLANLAGGLAVALSPENLLYCFIGTLLGTFIGVLPGVGPLTTIALLLPLTFSLPPDSAIIMLAGVYYGSQYGGSTTAILINLPGETSSAITALDGYALAKQGQAGKALVTAALASFIAGTAATFVIVILAPPLAKLATQFGPPEYFSLIILGFVLSTGLSRGSLVKALAMTGVGILIGLVGRDIYTGTARFVVGQRELQDGIDFVPLAIGLFGLAEMLRNIGNAERRDLLAKSVKVQLPSWAELKRIMPPITRGTLIGSVLGVLPGAGTVLSSFTAYAAETRLSKNRAQFGKGALEGVAAPEAANNAASQTSFIPMLTLGIPGNAITAVLLGALTIFGITPGPTVMTREPELFWGLVASMWVGNTMLMILNVPLVGIWVRMLTIPFGILVPVVLVFSVVGTYLISMSALDLYMLTIFGLLGYVFSKLDCEPAPLILGFVLGPLLEQYLRSSMLLSRGSVMIFLERPVSLGLLAVAAIVIVTMLLPFIRRKKDSVLIEES